MMSWWQDLSWIVPLRSAYLTPIFMLFTNLGTLIFYVLMILLISWLWQPRMINRLLPFVVLSTIINSWAKFYFADPRPLQFVVPGYHADGFGLPSGHAQLAVLFWGAIAMALYRHHHWRWRVLLPVFVAGMIAASRPYLGVHDIEDIWAGSVIGLGLLFLYACIERFDIDIKPAIVLLAITALALLAFVTWPSSGTTSDALFVIAPALALKFSWYGVRAAGIAPQLLPGRTTRRLLLAVAGLAFVVVMHFLVRQILPDWQAQTMLLLGVGLLGAGWAQATSKMSLHR